jgi:hypothetical protein
MVTAISGGQVAVILLPVNYIVGRINVPEPPTAILLGIGLACLGLACPRARGRQSAAV